MSSMKNSVGKDPFSKNEITFPQSSINPYPSNISYQLINATKAVGNIETAYRAIYDQDRKLRKTKEHDARTMIDELSRLLRASDARATSATQQNKSLRLTLEKAKEQIRALSFEKSKLISQLEGIFSLYNRKKKNFEDKESSLRAIESERNSLKIQNETLSKENFKLQSELNHGNDKGFQTKYSKDLEHLERRVEEKERRLNQLEDERFSFKRTETDLRQRIEEKDRRIHEMEEAISESNTKLNAETQALHDANEELQGKIRKLERTIKQLEKEDERRNDEERKLRKEIARLTFSNDELTEEVEHFKTHKSRVPAEETFAAKDSLKIEKLAMIEKKLETLMNLTSNKRNEESEEEEQASEEANSEDMLHELTEQILDKEELKNAHIIQKFKLDQIQLEDRKNEYKNLLKAMGALYFANRYEKFVPALYNYWKELTQEAINEAEQEAEEEEEHSEKHEDEMPEKVSDELINVEDPLAGEDEGQMELVPDFEDEAQSRPRAHSAGDRSDMEDEEQFEDEDEL